MARHDPKDDWIQERRDALRAEKWTIDGPGRLVKITALTPTATGAKPRTEVGGYITIGISIVNKRPLEIAQAAGLYLKDYVNGARIYMLAQLPGPSAVEYDLTAKFPAGLAYVEGQSSPKYLPGDATIHQWWIRDGIKIPVCKDFVDLLPTDKFTYADLEKKYRKY